MRNSGNNYAEMTLFESLLAMAGTATLALIFSLLFALDWEVSSIIVGATAVLTGAVLFTFVEVRRLGAAAKDERGSSGRNASRTN
jgi:uncharacterized integral membrane protein